MKNKIIISMFVLVLGILLNSTVFAQEFNEQKPITQEQFAVEIVKLMDIENLLPSAALPKDNVNLLESLGIAPLKGWKNKELLKNEDYLVIVAKASGKEASVHKAATMIEEKNIALINEKWQESHKANQYWVSLGVLLNDSTVFPNGAPESPYGRKYEDKNNDHKVDPFHSIFHSDKK